MARTEERWVRCSTLIFAVALEPVRRTSGWRCFDQAQAIGKAASAVVGEAEGADGVRVDGHPGIVPCGR